MFDNKTLKAQSAQEMLFLRLKCACEPARRAPKQANYTLGFGTSIVDKIRAVTVLDFFSPRWSSNKYRGLAVNRTTPPTFFSQVKKKRGRTCANAWSAAPKFLLHIAHALQSHAHCSRSQISLITWRDAHSARGFVGRAYTHCISTSAKVHSRLSNGGFGFQTKVKDCFLNQRRWHK